jgi:hypothetical protein
MIPYLLLGEIVHYVPESIPDFMLSTMSEQQRKAEVDARAATEFAAIITNCLLGKNGNTYVYLHAFQGTDEKDYLMVVHDTDGRPNSWHRRDECTHSKEEA